MNFTTVIVSFNSSHLLEKNIQSIEKKNQIIIIENSLDVLIKTKLEKLYDNVEVIIPKKNLGFGGGLNLGIKKSKNTFVICIVPDAILSKECYLGISNVINNFDEFALITPTHSEKSPYKNYDVLNTLNTKTSRKTISEYFLQEVHDIDGRVLIINKNKFDTYEILDDNIFMYFEYADLSLRLIKKNEKLYVIKNLKFDLSEVQSYRPEFNHQLQIAKSWHYCWSKFYFYKKHYNYIFALRKTFPNLMRAVKSCIYYKFKNNDYNFSLHKSELSGLLNSYVLKDSYYRPRETIKK